MPDKVFPRESWLQDWEKFLVENPKASMTSFCSNYASGTVSIGYELPERPTEREKRTCVHCGSVLSDPP